MIKRPGWYAQTGLAALVGVLVSTNVLAQAGNCLPDIGNGNICTANDITPSIGSVSGPSGCTEGDYVSGLVVEVTFVQPASNSPDRYDIGVFVANDGGSPIGGASCTFDSLTPQLVNPTVADLASGAGPYRDIDGDSCGDVRATDVTVKSIALDPILCKDSDGDGNLDVGAVLTWSSNKQQDVCSDPGDAANFIPTTQSKCRYEENINLPIPVEDAPSIRVEKLATPSQINDNDLVTFDVVVINTSSASDTVSLDTLVDNVHGDLNGQGSCATPQTIAPGALYECSFQQRIRGAVGYVEVDTVTATARDEEGVTVSDNDDARVEIIGSTPPPSVRVFKVATPSVIEEPGGTIRFDIVLVNNGSGSVQFKSLDDSVFGDLTDAANAQVSNNTCLSLPTLTPTDRIHFCRFDAQVTGNAGDVHVNTITAGADGLSDNDSALVRIIDSLPVIEVDKSPNPKLLKAPGGEVTYTVVVSNAGKEPVTLQSLDDGLFNDIADAGNGLINSTTCVLGGSIPAGGSYTCSFEASVAGNAADFHTNTVTATAADDDANQTTAFDRATVFLVAFLPSTPEAVPTIGTLALIVLGLIMGFLGARRHRASKGKITKP